VVENGGTVTDAQPRRVSLDGLVPGLLSATAVTVAGLLVVDADWGASAGPVAVLWLTVLTTTAALALHRVLTPRARRRGGDRAHILVPLLLAAVIPVGVVAGGPVRDRYGTTAVWALIALLTHLTLAIVTRPGLRKRARAAAIAGLAVACLAAVAVERVSQRPWRAGQFRAVGVPLVAPEVPGYALTGAYAGRYSVLLLLTARSAGPLASATIDVGIETSPPAGSLGSCAGHTGEPFVVRVPGSEPTALFCLRGGAFRLWLHPGAAGADIEPMLHRITLRTVPAGELARYPDKRTSREAD
jgi:hypothetical protein